MNITITENQYREYLAYKYMYEMVVSLLKNGVELSNADITWFEKTVKDMKKAGESNVQ